MYVPSHFKEDDIDKLQQYIRDYGLGLLIVADDAGIEANHVPFYLSPEESGSLGFLQCHLARSNKNNRGHPLIGRSPTLKMHDV